jgi:hypothetical protein
MSVTIFMSSNDFSKIIVWFNPFSATSSVEDKPFSALSLMTIIDNISKRLKEHFGKNDFLLYLYQVF